MGRSLWNDEPVGAACVAAAIFDSVQAVTAVRRNHLWWAAALLAGFIVVTVLVVGGWSRGLDEWWWSLMIDLEVARLVSFARFLGVVGEFPLAFVFALLVGLVFILTKRWWALWAWLAMAGGAEVLSSITKIVVDRPRPPAAEQVMHAATASYPSGHAMVTGAAMGIGLAVIAGVIWPNRNRFFLVAGIVFTLTLAWSRTYLRVHWLTDVTGGLLLGSAVVVLVAGFLADRLPRDAAGDGE